MNKLKGKLSLMCSGDKVFTVDKLTKKNTRILAQSSVDVNNVQNFSDVGSGRR